MQCNKFSILDRRWHGVDGWRRRRWPLNEHSDENGSDWCDHRRDWRFCGSIGAFKCSVWSCRTVRPPLGHVKCEKLHQIMQQGVDLRAICADRLLGGHLMLLPVHMRRVCTQLAINGWLSSEIYMSLSSTKCAITSKWTSSVPEYYIFERDIIRRIH